MKNNVHHSSVFDLNDEQVVELIKAGHEHSETLFGELVRRHKGALLNRCRNRLGNYDDAEDVVQETLVRGYRALSRFNGDSNLRTWLIAIADNQCYTLTKKESRYTDCDHINELIELAELNQKLEAEAADATDYVQDTLTRLPDAVRDILHLRFHAELPITSISERLGLSLSATKMRLYRAQEMFEKLYPVKAAFLSNNETLSMAS
ncbi:MAG: RNA polymerase sigma factor [Neptunomonas phycophila]|uniref:RNA polymerase sigma factor n=1 Tax=Neptunomonas phycophila TaxID=1572645 RepID=UPI003B8E61CE